MANISAADVKRLRDLTSAGMMDSKKALEEADGDFDKAVEILRVKGTAKAAKRGAERTASAGLVAHAGQALVELNCETDFVAKGDDFVAAGRQVAEAADAEPPLLVGDGRLEHEVLRSRGHVFQHRGAIADPAEAVATLVGGLAQGVRAARLAETA